MTREIRVVLRLDELTPHGDENPNLVELQLTPAHARRLGAWLLTRAADDRPEHLEPRGHG